MSKWLLFPLVMLTRLLILIDPNHPFRKCDMSLASWEERGTELFRLYAYVLDIVIVSVVIIAVIIRWR